MALKVATRVPCGLGTIRVGRFISLGAAPLLLLAVGQAQVVSTTPTSATPMYPSIFTQPVNPGNLTGTNYSVMRGSGYDTQQRDATGNVGPATDSSADRRSSNGRPADKPTEFQQLVENTTGQRLPVFGASLFEDVPTTFAPVDNAPVSADYAIGVGDEVRVNLFGQVNQQGTFTVDRTGAISLPEIGTVHVAGLRFGELQRALKEQFGKVYRNFDLTVTLGQLRSMPVYVTGQARRPGMYTVSSLSTLLNALFVSGGVLPQGSLRAIQVERNGKTVTTFDLYDVLLRGDKTKDVKLEPGDVIFIPVAGPQVAVVGSVINPAIYEALPGTTVKDVIAEAGGGTSVATLDKIKLDRIFEHTMRSLIDVNLMAEQNPAVANGDILTVGAIVDKFTNTVTLRGNVANPGRYVWHPGMRVSELVPTKDALVTRDYFKRRNQLGQYVLEYAGATTPGGAPGNDSTQSPVTTRAQTAAPGQTPSQGQTQQLGGTAERDQQGALQAQGLTSSGVAEQQRNSGGTPSGNGGASIAAALTAGDSVFGPKTDVVMSAPDVNWSYSVIERQDPADLKTVLIPFSLGKVVLEHDKGQDLELAAGDVVTVFSTADVRVPTEQQTRFVRLEGEFVASGVYSVRPGETLRQLLARAGGFTPEAYLYGSTFTRQSTRRVEKQRLLEYADALDAQVTAFTSQTSARAVSADDAAASIAGASDARRAVTRLRQLEPEGRIILPLKPESTGTDAVPDLPLEDGDRFIVPRTPAVVNVQGQVYSSNAFVYEHGLKTKDYMKLAGGPDRLADKKRSFVLRADGSVISEQYAHVDRAEIYPGDTIVVPPMLQKRALLRNLLDISSIVGQFGLGAAAVEVLK